MKGWFLTRFLPSTALMRYSAALLLLGLLLPISAYAVDVPLGDPVYEYLERQNAFGRFETPLSGSYPLSRRDVARLLNELVDQTSEMGSIDRERLEMFRFRYTDDRFRLGDSSLVDYTPSWSPLADRFPLKSLNLYQDRRNALDVKGEGWGVLLNASIETRSLYSEVCSDSATGSKFIWDNGFSATAWLGDISIYAAASDVRISGDRVCVPLSDYPYRTKTSDNGSFDYYETEASVDYQNDHISLLLGKTENNWGPGEVGTLMLSGDGFPYTMLRFRGRLGPFELTSVQGRIEPEPPIVVSADTLFDDTIRRIYAEKWLAAYRIEVDVTKNLRVGFQEMAIYGERGMDLNYLPPLLFLRGMEQYTRDQDNMMMGLDLLWRLPHAVQLYQAILLDDLQFSDLGTEKYTNKQAYLFGAIANDPLGLDYSKLNVEYVRLRPYVYTHKYPVNIAQHYGRNLGMPLEPNSDRLSFAFEMRPVSAVKAGVVLERIRHGANTREGRNVGGDVLRSHRDGGSVVTPFLDGDLETTDRVIFSAEVEAMMAFYVGVSIGYESGTVEYETGGSAEHDGVLAGFSLRWYPMRW